MGRRSHGQPSATGARGRNQCWTPAPRMSSTSHRWPRAVSPY